jgi:nitroimidazol reductase NimA-like FMN-containing flavoprotein (pyridoxamine 5'-phosphate oxidase superfamily)
MTMSNPGNGRLDARYSDPTAEAMPLDDASGMLARAPLYWLSTVRPDGRPHVTPIMGVWRDGGVCFCTGPEERKNRNLAGNPECVVATGTNSLDQGVTS